MIVKPINKTQEIKKHFLRYGSLDRLQAIQKFRCFDLPDVIRRLRNQGMNIEPVPGYDPNTKYQFIRDSKNIKG